MFPKLPQKELCLMTALLFVSNNCDNDSFQKIRK